MEPVIYKIFRLLTASLESNMYQDLRQRLATPEQWAREQADIVRNTQLNWATAKHLICENKQEVDEWVKENKGASDMYETIASALQVIEEEMTQKLEQVITEEEDEDVK